jgi:uncharacterized protein (DUF736 family)
MPKQESIGALWINLSQKGEEYLTGIIDGKKVVAFRNKNKQGKQPDWKVYSQKPKDEIPPPEDDDVSF